MSNTHALREFLDAAALIGYTLDGYDGNSHPRLRHSSGFTISVSRTPSDYRSRRNELARLERLAGRKLPRANAAHYRGRRTPISNLAQTDHERAAAAHVEQLIAQADGLRRQWADITTRPPGRDGAAAARKTLASFEHIRTELAALHRHIPPITAGGAA